MRYVIIGSSAAGINAIRELRKYDQEGEIILVSKDKTIYSRCILHQYLSGERTLERLNFAEPDFDTLYRVNWLKGREAIALRPENHMLVLDGYETLSYDKLLIATGSHTFIPPIKGLSEADNYRRYRSAEKGPRKIKEHRSPGIGPDRHRLRHRLPSYGRKSFPG